ncbi:hypothetical protein [Longimicrobium sp.]|uniref:hypothetical protein n=1 Tax=Longimicrobium sp. TaxID=2029185 RepID=UPI002B940CC9|nr:hypothetical protein [Longimicrobium sp.]HSU14630.1 hypothetical protein [Longimicrobium sp.]
MMERVRRTNAISVEDLNAALAEFHEEGVDGETIAGANEEGPADWIWVKWLGNRYYLNGDTTWEGVGEYLELVKKHGSGLAWSLVPNGRGEINQVAFGPAKTVIPGFHFYRADT